MSGGLCHLATDPEAAASYFKAVAFGIGLPEAFGDPADAYPHYPEEFVEEIAQVWGEGVVNTAEYLRSLGEIQLLESMPNAAFPEFPGAEGYGTFSAAGRGVAVFEVMADAVREREIQIMWGTPGKRLIMDAEGRVIGVVAERDGQEVNIKARRAVVLTTGGFEYDDELKEAFLPGWRWVFMGNPDNTGDGVRMAIGAGAALGHMYHSAARVVAGTPELVETIGTGMRIAVDQPGMLLVDNYGKRYINEVFTSVDPQRYQFYNEVIVYDISRLSYPRIPSWLIFDETVRQAGPLPSLFYGAHAVGLYEWSEDNSKEIEAGWILQADTLEELAARIAEHPHNKSRMDAATLAATVTTFNEYSKAGEDPDFQRDPETLGALETPPYYAIAMYPGGPNTEGGPIKNAKSQVINVHGEPIPRLYAVGELGSLFAFAYQGGGNIAELIIFGQIAGQNAAAEPPLD
jgi:3-oxosteroid 1-dehydrogenase